jgi:single-stranded-DNA-specific exonuclease
MATEKRWNIQTRITEEAAAALGKFPPLLQQILFNRGYASYEKAKAFLYAATEINTDPFQMTGMEAAVDRICRALKDQEAIAIYGDYDVDGVTATALLMEALGALGANVEGYIPNRFDEGYGLNKDALEALKDKGVQLVITVDCGIRSPDEANYARQLGLDLIISDHHHPAEGDLPPALAVINPKQPGDGYPDKDLAGVGIAYKIAEALFTRQEASISLDSLLDLVALGTVADLAPLAGENRSLVRRGLRQMQATTRQGLFALAGVADLSLPKANAGHIGFMLGPRLNASGRLESALASLELLTTKDFMRAGQLAQQLNLQNRKRQELTREIQEQAEILAMEEDPDAYLLFAAHENFNPGVVGLAASRLAETHYRPAIVAFRGPEETRGSCRSIPEFHITNALDQCKDLMVRHGGHAAAAGFTVKNENLEELVSRLKELARTELEQKDLRPTLTADAEVPLKEMRPEVAKYLAYLEPTGYGNPEPTFASKGVKVRYARTVGAEGKHLKLTLEDESGYTHDAIGFRLGEMQPLLNGRADILFTYEVNEYNGRTNYQLNLKDIRPARRVE